MASLATLPVTGDVPIPSGASAGRVTFDPRVWIVGFVSGVFWISMAGSIVAAIAAVVLLALARSILMAQARQDGVAPFPVWTLAIVGSCLTVFLHVLFGPHSAGEGVPVMGIHFHTSSLTHGLLMALRLSALLLLSSTVLSQVSATSLAAGMARLLLPLKRVGLAVGQVYYLAFFVSRSLPLLIHESRMLRIAQRSRGVVAKTWWRGRLRSVAALVMPVFASALRRADAMSLALASRGFDPQRVPSAVVSLRFRKVDHIALALLMTGWAGWIVLRVTR